MESLIFYFTGTGNSLKVARDLQVELKECELNPIAKAIREEYCAPFSDKVGFIFPLYYYGLPKIVFDFINKINLNKVKYIFAIVTRAGDVDGVPLVQIEKILRKKSKTLNAGFFIKMPDNFILASTEISQKEKQDLFEKEGEQIKQISIFIKNAESNLKISIDEEKPNRIERGNLRFHQNVNKGDKSFFTDEKCNSCGICEKICPVNNILLNEGKPQWQHKCEQCLACINLCPTTAIQYGKNTIAKKRYHHPEIKVDDLLF